MLRFYLPAPPLFTHSPWFPSKNVIFNETKCKHKKTIFVFRSKIARVVFANKSTFRSLCRSHGHGLFLNVVISFCSTLVYKEHQLKSDRWSGVYAHLLLWVFPSTNPGDYDKSLSFIKIFCLRKVLLKYEILLIFHIKSTVHSYVLSYVLCSHFCASSERQAARHSRLWQNFYSQHSNTG